MILQRKQTVILLICTFIIGNLCGYFISDNTKKQGSEIEFSDVQKHELNIDADFFEIDPLVYDKGHLKTKVHLNGKGMLYTNTQLFAQNYIVTVELIDNTNGEPYFISDEIPWDINQELSLDVVVDANQIVDQYVLSDFNKQIEKMKEGEEHHIMYHVEVVSANKVVHISDLNGMLYVK